MKYTQPQKAVAVLLALGQPQAATVLARMSGEETDRLLSNSRKMRSVPPEDLAAIANDFEQAFNRVAAIYDADSRFQQLVSEARGTGDESGSDQATATITEAPAEFVFTAFDKAPVEEIVEFLSSESILVSACVLARLPGDGAGDVLQLFDEPRRQAIFKAMATLGDVQGAALQSIDEAAIGFFNAKKAASNAGKLKGLAKMLNAIDRESAEGAIRSLQDTFEEKDLLALRSMLFRFEDVVKLETTARSAVFDAIPSDTITLALRDADEGLREAILSSISQRTRRIIESDLKVQSKLDQSAVRNAQKLIVSQILNLATAGSLTLPTDDAEAA
jgi:flagellar motor switch protein FliG